MDEREPVRFDTRAAVVLRDDLAAWQELNVTAFLAVGIAAEPGMIGEPYADADGTAYLPLLRQPLLVFSADAAALAAIRERAVGRGLRLAVYTREMFATMDDASNRAAVRAVRAAELDLVGLGIHGPRNAVDRTVKGARLHD
ncbi:MAG TPA: DUF2000 domain-containing protein [Pseudolysinimonas sp.]|nr:DUF2000 domain-containing protein [Pseudolysinimonas sp.]